jgi:DNA-binding MarR family transcriptional regulator
MPRTRHPLRSRALDGIRALVSTLSRSARSVERRTGVTTAQLFVLRELATTSGISLSQVADRTLTQQSTVSIIVRRLVDNGLVRSKRAADDRRRLELSLTAAGRRLVASAPVPTTGRLLSALDRLSQAEITALVTGLDGLTRALGVERRATRMLFE